MKGFQVEPTGCVLEKSLRQRNVLDLSTEHDSVIVLGITAMFVLGRTLPFQVEPFTLKIKVLCGQAEEPKVGSSTFT